MHSNPSILAVIVLYNCELSRSQSFSSFLEVLDANPELAKRFSLVVYDNSPQAQRPVSAADFPTHYVHDPSNGGLASAYNFALARAESEEREWPTRAFLCELVDAATAMNASAQVAAIVPKLVVNGEIHSPATEFIEQMRRQFQRPEQAIPENAVGIMQQPLCPYNSGSTVRVSALRSIGGFPAEFWLDYLDHAVFHALYVHGYRVYVMLAKLAHDSSHSDIGSVPIWRLQNVLMAQTLYVKQSGNFIDRLLFRIWLLRQSRNLRRACKDPQMWRRTVLQAFLLRDLKEPRPS
jgi:GT2 family glycosyltransferase